MANIPEMEVLFAETISNQYFQFISSSYFYGQSVLLHYPEKEQTRGGISIRRKCICFLIYLLKKTA